MTKQELNKEIQNVKPQQLLIYDYVETIKNTDRVLNAVRARIKGSKKPLMLVIIEQD